MYAREMDRMPEAREVWGDAIAGGPGRARREARHGSPSGLGGVAGRVCGGWRRCGVGGLSDESIASPNLEFGKDIGLVMVSDEKMNVQELDSASFRLILRLFPPYSPPLSARSASGPRRPPFRTRGTQ